MMIEMSTSMRGMMIRIMNNSCDDDDNEYDDDDST